MSYDGVRYEECGVSDSVPMFHKPGTHLYMLRWHNAGADACGEHQGKEWFLADLGPDGQAGTAHNNIDYYVSDGCSTIPPKNGWSNSPRSTFKNPQGILPAPTVVEGWVPSSQGPEKHSNTVFVEPLTEYALIKSHVLRTTAIQDPEWQLFCREIVGARIQETLTERLAKVLAVRLVGTGQIVHKLEYEDDETSIWVSMLHLQCIAKNKIYVAFSNEWNRWYSRCIPSG